MIKYTQQYLKKLEDFLKENLYEVRYEKGNFKSGYCILEAKKVVVINKFATIESRIQALFEISNMLLAHNKITSDVNHLFLKPGKEPQAIPSYIAEADMEVAEQDSN
jgi:hypothetical protein